MLRTMSIQLLLRLCFVPFPLLFSLHTCSPFPHFVFIAPILLSIFTLILTNFFYDYALILAFICKSLMMLLWMRSHSRWKAKGKASWVW